MWIMTRRVIFSGSAKEALQDLMIAASSHVSRDWFWWRPDINHCISLYTTPPTIRSFSHNLIIIGGNLCIKLAGKCLDINTKYWNYLLKVTDKDTKNKGILRTIGSVNLCSNTFCFILFICKMDRLTDAFVLNISYLDKSFCFLCDTLKYLDSFYSHPQFSNNNFRQTDTPAVTSTRLRLAQLGVAGVVTGCCEVVEQWRRCCCGAVVLWSVEWPTHTFILWRGWETRVKTVDTTDTCDNSRYFRHVWQQ